MVQVWCRCGTDVVQVWYRCGPGVLRVWYGGRPGVAQVWYRLRTCVSSLSHLLSSVCLPSFLMYRLRVVSANSMIPVSSVSPGSTYCPLSSYRVSSLVPT